MKRLIVISASVLALALAGSAADALVPGVFDPGATGCPVATYTNGVLHLAKNCPTPTNALRAWTSPVSPATFTPASFTLASATQCNGGSPFEGTRAPGALLPAVTTTPVINVTAARRTHRRDDDRGGRRQVPA